MNIKHINNKLINVIIAASYIIIIGMLVTSVIAWEKTADWIFIISGSISILGILFNIYLYSREKSKNKEL
ncbi:hypothetical protein Pryu01_02373 [Paraliobacillus ryukyuensis]|uniref:Uncharacterized protein n=1 Tax=Paraliobacillus ryukyuensis TaxID=200904 RepID=A0A366DYI5_9BACI|nr:hypothetical protein [Paraliobacillus ryukyuensis]RBO94589.1 hypothetical protein DES48_11076 [Paraliobacillus ryukyuensis]